VLAALAPADSVASKLVRVVDYVMAAQRAVELAQAEMVACWVQHGEPGLARDRSVEPSRILTDIRIARGTTMYA